MIRYILTIALLVTLNPFSRAEIAPAQDSWVQTDNMDCSLLTKNKKKDKEGEEDEGDDPEDDCDE